MKQTNLKWVWLAVAAFLPSSAVFAHARLAFPGTDAQVGELTPRNNNAGIKVGPCGGLARGATNKVLTAGATITVRWVETINHPGSYHFDFSPAGDTNWVRLKTVVDDQNGGGLPHQYSTTLTVPNTPCENCTIRLIQEMTDRNPPTFYYSCSDIKINAATTQPPDGGGGGNTNPTVPDELNDPDSDVNCHP